MEEKINIKQLKKDGLLLNKFEIIFNCPKNNDKRQTYIVLCMKGDRSASTYNIFTHKQFKGSVFNVRRNALKENNTPKTWIQKYSKDICVHVREELSRKNISEDDFINDAYDKNIPIIFDNITL